MFFKVTEHYCNFLFAVADKYFFFSRRLERSFYVYLCSIPDHTYEGEEGAGGSKGAGEGKEEEKKGG